MKKIGILLVLAIFAFGCQKMASNSELDNDLDQIVDTDDGEQVTAPGSFVMINTDGGEIKVDVVEAITPEEKAKGLSGQETIEKAMFFIFDEEAKYPFTTQGMLAPIDIIFIGSNEKVAHIEKNVPIGKDIVESSIPFQFVLEVEDGFADEKGVKVGDKVKWFLSE